MDQSSELNLMMEESNSCDKPNQLGDPEWKFIESFRTENDYTSYLADYTHKMTTSHGSQKCYAKGCEYQGNVHIHKINFELKSCTCRWFLGFAMCSHLLAACDKFNIKINGYSKPKTFVYRARRGRKQKLVSFTAAAFTSNMPVILPPALEVQDRHQDLFLIGSNFQEFPSINQESQPFLEPISEQISEPISEPKIRITRSYKNKNYKEKVVKRLVKKRHVKVSSPAADNIKKKRGRPRKIGPALVSD